MIKDKFSPIFRSLSANLDDLDRKTFNGFTVRSKHGTYYTNTTIEKDGNRRTEFEEHSINMPTVLKSVQDMALSVSDVLE